MIILFTDFGLEGPYIGQVQAVLAREAPGAPVINLSADAPVHNPKASAYLLAAYCTEFPPDTVFFCVIDPGVGSAERRPMVVHADGRWFVGPDNGLFNVVGARATHSKAWAIDWRPERLSATFHGRDLFAPVVASIATGQPLLGPEVHSWVRGGWPADLWEVVYIDHFGNAMTGVRANTLEPDTVLQTGGLRIKRASTFSEVPKGEPFWYENANGLAEIAVNQGRAADWAEIRPGQPVTLA